MSTYRPTDLIMISPEVYQLTLASFGHKVLIIDLVVLALQIYILSKVIHNTQGESNWHSKVFIWSQIIEWTLLALAFYPFYFSEVTWYWPWPAGICLAQVLMLSINFYAKPSFTRSLKVLSASILTFLLFELGVIAIFPGFLGSLILYGPIQAALISLLFTSIIKPSLACLAMIPIPILVIAHELLLYGGR